MLNFKPLHMTLNNEHAILKSRLLTNVVKNVVDIKGTAGRQTISLIPGPEPDSPLVSAPLEGLATVWASQDSFSTQPTAYIPHLT